ncbi:zinc finger protein 574 [Alligator mississippiensis]|uniref:Zinc finger protein 574 n=2 Tax=Alligator mississippiensis TaxID=8496 RepID=A0A151P5R1_ALLMI|nr:zinc finger protein 574 [Alligator mississippiensis]
MAAPEEETLVFMEHRYVCSECSQLYGSLEEAVLHQQTHLAPEPRYEVLGLAGEAGAGLYQAVAVPESSQFQCLECGQLLLTPSQLLEHQDVHLKLLSPEAETPPKPVPAVPAATAGQIHYECVDCKALFTSQEVWLAHRAAHRTPEAPAQSQALVRLEHSYRKPEEEAAAAAAGGAATADLSTVQLLLYECGECLQLFQTPKEFLEHQAGHLAPAAPPAVNGTAPVPAEPAGDHSYELKGGAPHRCGECELALPTARALELHRRAHRRGAFPCALCSRALPSPAALAQHAAQHSGESRLLCLDCGLAFDTEPALLAHRRAHGPNPLHRCPCGKAFLNMTKFLYHRRTHGPLPPTPEAPAPAEPAPVPAPEAPVPDTMPLTIIYSDGSTGGGGGHRCLACGKAFGKQLQLARHQRFVHGLERRHECHTCGKRFKKKSHVRNHLLTHTGERPFACPDCPKAFNSQANLLRHRLTHTGERPYQCQVCLKRFTQSSTLQQHLFVHSRHYPYQCPECGVHFHRPYRLLMHRYHHTGEYPYKCGECGRSFLLRRLLDVHRLGHAGRQPHVCGACGAAFATAPQLREHRCGKAGRRHECATCGKKVSTAARLRAHERVHEAGAGAAQPVSAPLPPPPAPRRPAGPKSFECSECKKLFSTETSLQVHRRIHTGERPYPCPDCGKAFRQSTHLKDHRRLHTGERPYKCEQCGKAFAIAVRLAEHRRTHTGERPYACPHCPKAYRSFSNLWKHRKLHQAQRRAAAPDPPSATAIPEEEEEPVVPPAANYAPALAIMETIEIYPAPPAATEAVTTPLDGLHVGDGV